MTEVVIILILHVRKKLKDRKLGNLPKVMELVSGIQVQAVIFQRLWF